MVKIEKRPLQHFCSGMCRNQNFEFLDEKVIYVFRRFGFFLAFSFSPFGIFLLQLLTFHWACLQFKKL